MPMFSVHLLHGTSQIFPSVVAVSISVFKMLEYHWSPRSPVTTLSKTTMDSPNLSPIFMVTPVTLVASRWVTSVRVNIFPVQTVTLLASVRSVRFSE